MLAGRSSPLSLGLLLTLGSLLLPSLVLAQSDEPSAEGSADSENSADDKKSDQGNVESGDSSTASSEVEADPASEELSERAEGSEDEAEESEDEAEESEDEAEESEDELSTALEGGGLFENSLSGAEAEGSSSLAEKSFELSGYVRGDVFVGSSASRSEATLQAAYGELALQVRARKGELGDAFAELRLQGGKVGENQELKVDLREAYVNLYAGPVELRLGKQIVVWGRADAFNPTSNITPVDFRVRSPIEDDRRYGNVGARMFLNLSPFRLEGVWMPLYESTLYPPVELDELVSFTEPDNPRAALREGLGAGRIHWELPAFETSLSYLFGYALLPGFELQGYEVGVEADVRVTRTPYQHHVVGFDFSTAIGEIFALRGEAAYRHPLDYEEYYSRPNPDLQYVVGVDRAFGQLSLIAQYLGRYTFNWDATDSGNANSDLLRSIDPSELTPLVDAILTENLQKVLGARNQANFSQLAAVQHSVSLRAEWLALHETLSLSALGMLNITTREFFVFPKIGYDFSDGIKAFVGAEIYSGPDGTLFDFVETSLSAVYTELRLSF